MRLPKKFSLPNIFSLATRRGVRTKAVVITMALVCTLFSGYTALAGQGYSQWCNDGVGNGTGVNDPATAGAEAGMYLGDTSYSIACYSTTPYGSGDPEVTGGAVGVNTPTQNGASASCLSDPAAMVRLDCNNAVSANTSNPTSPGANASSSNTVNVLGTPLNAPSVGAGTDCASGAVAVSVYSCATGQYAGISGTGDSSGLLAVSGTGCAWGWYLGVSPAGCAYSTLAAASATGPATAYGNSSELGAVPNGFGVSGTNSGYGWFLGISGTGYASGVNAISGTGNSYANTYHVYPGVYLGNSISGTGSAEGVIAVGGNGCSVGWYLGVNAQGCANSTLLAISGTGPATAYGNSQDLVVAGTVIPNGFGVSGTNNAYGWLLGVSGTGSASGVNAISGAGTANASGSGLIPGVAISGMGPANGSFLSVSGTGPAYGNGINIDASTQLLSDANLPGDEEAATVSEMTGALDLPEADELPTGGINLDAHVNNVLSLIDETTNNPTAFANQATNSPESNMRGSEQKGIPSCKNITYRANAGSIYVQTSSWRYVQWGIYLYDGSEEAGPWWVNVYVNKTRVDAKSPPSQDYAPHGSIHPSDAKKGGTLRFEVRHQSNKTKRWYRSTTNGCRIPNYG